MARFSVAQDGVATDLQLEAQIAARDSIAASAAVVRRVTEPSRAQSLALTKLEEALMWAEYAIFVR